MTAITVEMYFAKDAAQPVCTVNPKKFRLYSADPKLNNCGIFLPETFDGKITYKIKQENDGKNRTFGDSADSIKYVILADPDHSTNDPQTTGYILTYKEKISDYEISAHYVPFGENIQYSVRYYIDGAETWIDPGVRYPGFLLAHLLLFASFLGSLAVAAAAHLMALAALRRRA